MTSMSAGEKAVSSAARRCRPRSGSPCTSGARGRGRAPKEPEELRAYEGEGDGGEPEYLEIHPRAFTRVVRHREIECAERGIENDPQTIETAPQARRNARSRAE